MAWEILPDGKIRSLCGLTKLFSNFRVECREELYNTAPESKDDGKDVTMRGPLFLLLNLT